MSIINKLTITLGSFYILVGLLANEWILIPLFSSDGEIPSLTRLLILGFELILIGLGIATIYFPHLSLTININLLTISSLLSWGVAEFYLNYKYIHNAVLLAQDETISDDVGDLRAPDGYLHHKMRKKGEGKRTNKEGPLFLKRRLPGGHANL